MHLKYAEANAFNTSRAHNEGGVGGTYKSHFYAIVYTSRFGVILANSRNCSQITATPRNIIFHAAKSSQMPYAAKIKQLSNFYIQFRIS